MHSFFMFPCILTSQVTPGAPLTNCNDGGGGGGGPTEVRILYPEIITTLEFVYPKNHYFL